ncbi:MAG: HD domain-containing protein [Patescibacteria group bacterium]
MLYKINYIKKALYFAAQKHNGQFRRIGNLPYIVHPTEVAFDVSKYTDDEEIISAAFLHDVLEDCAVSVDTLKKEFNSRIAKIVKEISFTGEKKLSWKENQEVYLQKIQNASKEALIIVAVDKMNNIQDYFHTLKNEKKKLKNLFFGTPEEYIWFYDNIQDILISKLGRQPIVKKYQKIWKENKNL